jgi:four helix bundle protein
MPESEKYGIRSQIARASVSIAANIAEGTGRGTVKDYRRFLRLAYASACEVQSHALVAAANELVDPRAVSEIVDHADEVRRMLKGLMKSVTI